MLAKILPSVLYSAIEKLKMDKLYEIRMRCHRPILVNYGGSFYHLNEGGICKTLNDSILHCDQKIIESIVYKAGEYSIYAVNNQLKQGFVTITGGIRLGICGELVIENNEIRTIKGFTSINIRIPHEVKGCGLTAFKFITQQRLHNSLIVGKPCSGKTTILRDLAKNFSLVSPTVNTLVLDERNEIAASAGGVAQLDVGQYTDVLTNCTKSFGFLQGVRVMRPDIIICDELATQEDLEAAQLAASSGVTVIASVHAHDCYDLSNKKGFEVIFKRRFFTRFVVVSDRKGPGTYEGVYDENLNNIFYGG